MGIILLVSASCKSVDPSLYTIHCDSVAYTKHQSVDTVVVRDSVFVREVMKGDTVYLTRVEWRDRWRTHLVHDTIVRTDSIVQVIEHPPERYVPPFYKWCVGLLMASLVLAIGRLALKRWL